MIPSDPEQIFKIAQNYADQGDYEFANNYYNEAMNEYDRLYGKAKQKPQADLYNRLSTDEQVQEERPPSLEQSSNNQNPSIWERLQGYGDRFNDHMREYGLGYVATVPFLAAGLGGLAYGLGNNKKRRH